MGYKKVYVISRSNSLWKVNNAEYTTENFIPDKNKIELETGWILHGADPRKISKNFNDCFLSQDAAEIECKKRNESLGYISTKKKEKKNNLLSDIKKWEKYINQVCTISYYCTIYDVNKRKVVISNKKFRFITYIEGFLKVGYFYEPNSFLDVKTATSLQVNNLNFNCGGYSLLIGDYIIVFVHFLQRTQSGNRFSVKDIEIDGSNYNIIPY